MSAGPQVDWSKAPPIGSSDVDWTKAQPITPASPTPPAPTDNRNFIQKSFDENTTPGNGEPLLEHGLKHVVHTIGEPFVERWLHRIVSGNTHIPVGSSAAKRGERFHCLTA